MALPRVVVHNVAGQNHMLPLAVVARHRSGLALRLFARWADLAWRGTASSRV